MLPIKLRGELLAKQVTKCTSKRYAIVNTVSKDYIIVGKFLSFLPTKDLAPFSYTYPTKKLSFKPINDQFVVAGIC